MENLILIAFLLLIGRIALLLVHPVHRCPSCRGRRVVPGRRAPFERCRKCRGTGRAYRAGAQHVHRVAREHAWPWLRERIMTRLNRDDDQ